MARNLSGVYSLPAGSIVSTGDTILPTQHNTPLNDIASDLNLPRPIVAGGTGADNAASALVNLGLTATAAEINSALDGITATATELNTLDGITASTAELNILDGVTASTAELNILDGVTATAAELNILDGVTATATEINAIDGVTATGTNLIRAADAAAGRSAINAAPLPAQAAGVGQWLGIAASSGNALALPSGGTWAYFVISTNVNGEIVGFATNVVAGGTTIVGAAAGVASNGIAWRVS